MVRALDSYPPRRTRVQQYLKICLSEGGVAQVVRAQDSYPPADSGSTVVKICLSEGGVAQVVRAQDS